jgi:hypothetical protein
MPKRPADYEDEAPTRVETPLPTRYRAETRTYHFRDEEPAERQGMGRA